MAIFSNSDEGLSFEANVCETCLHYSPDRGCPILTAHAAFQGSNDGNAQAILDMLVGRSKVTGFYECEMYVERPGQVPWE